MLLKTLSIFYKKLALCANYYINDRMRHDSKCVNTYWKKKTQLHVCLACTDFALQSNSW